MNNLETTLLATRQKLADIEKDIAEKQREIDNFEYESSDAQYDEYLDDMGDVEVCGCTFSPSEIIKKLDPVAYRCGKSDYDSEIELSDVQEYIDLLSEIEELENEKDDLECEISDLELGLEQ